MNPIEPHADIRFMTASVRQVFLGLVEAGFTDAQALHLTAEWWKSLSPKGNTNG